MSEREREPEKKNVALRSGISNVAAALLVVVIVGVVNYLAYRHYTRFDWTSAGLYTLSGRTKAVLRGLDRDLDLYIFMSTKEPGYHDLQELLSRYGAETSHLRVHQVDPYARPQEFMALVQRFHLLAGQDQDTGEVQTDVEAVMVAGDRTWKIDRDDLVSLDLGEGDEVNEATVRQQVKTEQALTGAIVQVTSGPPTKACFTRGHGEWSLEEGAGERTLTMAKESLERDNVTTTTVALGPDGVPHDCDAVFVIGPQTAFTEAEAATLSAYVRRGGNVLLTLDPVLGEGRVEPTGLEAFARALGATVDADVVVETDRARVLQQDVFLVTDLGRHATTDALRRREDRIGMRIVRSIRPAAGGHATELLKTSAEAFGETTVSELAGDTPPARNGSDPAGPLAIAVAIDTHQVAQGEDEGHAHHAAPGGRVILVGGSEWLRSDFLERTDVFGNHDLFDGFAGWLTQRPALISIAPRRMRIRAVSMTSDDLTGVAFRVLGLLPAAGLFLGIAVWWTRRS